MATLQLPTRLNLPFARGATILTITSAVSYILGLLRDRVLAATYGASDALDAYQAAFVIPDIIFNLFLAGALSAAFLPVYNKLTTKKQQQEAARLAGTLLVAGSGLLAIVAAVAFAAAPTLVPLVAPGFSLEKQQLLVGLTRVMLLSPILFLISNLLGSMLISSKRFLWYGLSPVLYNLGIIIGITALTPTLGIYAAAVGTIGGAGLHLTARIIDLRRANLRLIPSLTVSPAVKKVLRLMMPRIVGLSAVQVQLWLFIAIASTLGGGAVTIYSLARNFQSFPVSLIGIAFATSLFPLLAESANRNNHREYFKQLKQGITTVLALTIPAAAVLYLLRVQIIDFFVGAGRFDNAAVAATAAALGIYTLSIPTESLVHVLARAFYALHNTITPVVVSLIAIATSVTTAALAAPVIGISSIPAGFALGTGLQAILLGTLLRIHAQHDIKASRNSP